MTLNDRMILLRFGDRLTEKELQVLELQARGMSQRMIALALGLSRSAVQSRLETATRRLKQILEEEGVIA